MPTTRQMVHHGDPEARKPISFAEIEARGYQSRPGYIDTHPWRPTVSEVDSPIEYGMEVFFHKRMPDGTPLDVEDRRFIAAIVMNSLKGEK